MSLAERVVQEGDIDIKILPDEPDVCLMDGDRYESVYQNEALRLPCADNGDAVDFLEDRYCFVELAVI